MKNRGSFLLGLAIIAVIVIAVAVGASFLISTLSPRERTPPRPFFSSLDGLLPTEDEVPSKYHGEALYHGDNSTSSSFYSGLNETVGFREGRYASGSKCSEFSDRCRDVSFVLYRFTNGSMARAYFDRERAAYNYEEHWESPADVHLYYSDDEENRDGHSIGLVSNIVFKVNVYSEYVGFLGDNVKKDIGDFANLQLRKLL